ncbi:MAG: hypothetical protein ABIO76_00645, partial [Ginsengibacter sp.]
MKKLLLFLLVLIGAVVILIYIFIPSKIKFSKEILINTKAPLANRILMDENMWSKWFPRDSSDALQVKKGKHTLRLNSHNYT